MKKSVTVTISIIAVIVLAVTAISVIGAKGAAVAVDDIDEKIKDNLKQNGFNVAASECDLIENVEMVILAIKPQMFDRLKQYNYQGTINSESNFVYNVKGVLRLEGQILERKILEGFAY